MAYGNFKKIEKVMTTFALEVKEGQLFPADLKPITPTGWLSETLKMAESTGFVNEKERSERVVYPVLSELARNINHNSITIYSGRDLDVDAAKGLKGECDFLLALGKKPLILLDAPIFSVVEAKKEDMEYGISQCAAQMVGVQLFNQKRNVHLPVIYGVATDALKWVFMKLEDKTLTIDAHNFLITEIDKILGAFQFAIEECKKN